MVVLAFDTLAYAKKLERAGMPPEQAEIQAEALKAVVDGQAVALATKEDVERTAEAVKTELRAELKILDTRLKVVEKIGWAVVLGVLALLVKAFVPVLAAGG